MPADSAQILARLWYGYWFRHQLLNHSLCSWQVLDREGATDTPPADGVYCTGVLCRNSSSSKVSSSSSNNSCHGSGVRDSAGWPTMQLRQPELDAFASAMRNASVKTLIASSTQMPVLKWHKYIHV
jgi:hypothetical protein